MTQFFNFMQVHENEEVQAVSLAKEDICVLLLLHTIDTNNNKWKENSKFSNRHYHIKYIKDVQHKMSTWIGIIGSLLGTQSLQKSSKWEEEILFFCIIITWLIHNLLKLFVILFRLNVHVHPVFLNLINISYQLLIHHLNQGMLTLKIVTITKYSNITMIGSSWSS